MRTLSLRRVTVNSIAEGTLVLRVVNRQVGGGSLLVRMVSTASTSVTLSS